MDIAVVTGVSKGFGAALAKQLLSETIPLLGISRSETKALKKFAEEQNVYYEHIPCNLGDLEHLKHELSNISQKVLEQGPQRIIVINNAAVLEPVHHAAEIDANELIDHVQVNLLAPMLLLNHFLKVGVEEGVEVNGINITSGAARRPVYGWSAYGSSKAGIDLYTRTTALEQKERQTNHKVIGFNPGVMDTAMQEEIRSSSHEQFRDVKTFHQYHEQEQLKDPEEIAGLLLQVIMDENLFKNGVIYDPQDLL